MDKLIFIAGAITAALGIGFLITHFIYPFLSDAYVSGGVGGVVIGAGMMVFGYKVGNKKPE